MTDSDNPAVDAAREMDAADPLSDLRDHFFVPEGELYMDGSSLGPLSVDAETALDRVVDEWRDLTIRGRTDADPEWFSYGERLGDRLAPLAGAKPKGVVVADSTTVNIHALVGTFYDPAHGEKIVVDDLDFPTDHYVIRTQPRAASHDPDEAPRVVGSRDGRTIETEDVLDVVDDDAGMVFLPSVLYRSGRLFDIETLTEAVHEAGALAGFDLAHSVDAVPHSLLKAGVDFAVWYHYKYLNTGPGSITGLYANERHFGATPASAGWWGNDKETQFDMATTYEPARSAGAFQFGTVPVLSAASLDDAFNIAEDADGVTALREKSLALTDYLIALMDERLPECEVSTPHDPAARGGHVAVEHPEAYRVGLVLKGRGVIVDLRQSSVAWTAPAPAYVSFEDVYRAVEHFREILNGETYEVFEKQSGGVT